MTQPLLSVRNLCVDFTTDVGDIRACNNVSFDLFQGEVLGLAGESGCGKSTIALSLMRLLNPPAFIAGGEIIFRGEDILKYTEKQMQAFRWKETSMVFQSAMNALNPVLTIEAQFSDVIRHHTKMSRRQARQRAQELLEIVDIHPSRLSDYPHQFSGGMRQRLVIAIALALNPKIIIMDEPTTALDVVVQREILQKIEGLKAQFGFTILFITHDLSLMAEFSDRIGVMYSGELVEIAPSKDILTNPYHPYTEGLSHSFPSLTGPKVPLTGIPGNPLNLLDIPQGCRFQARCHRAHSVCRHLATQLRHVTPERLSNCHIYTDSINPTQLKE
ncbi:ABC transporter ATP-binding protein [Vibrio ostreicida]|uniref:ABC transporter ATP-binding protein n=1 Tax=Vibrio ostreicida TaxID=526588 RepID=A0ABT8BQB4_9VIBR|nr:ABC transporter ATP-binding protein [Vibrio ostreicida]MDN3609091.1 ABC transporter ATP-binding protein [Vibrio ostreicida]NPD07986.1 ABC transporter ATP-binding protein [Vibrio ostreicida]